MDHASTLAGIAPGVFVACGAMDPAESADFAEGKSGLSVAQCGFINFTNFFNSRVSDQNLRMPNDDKHNFPIFSL